MKEQSEKIPMLGVILIGLFILGWIIIGLKTLVFVWSIYGDRVLYVAGGLLLVAGVGLIAAARAAGVR